MCKLESGTAVKYRWESGKHISQTVIIPRPEGNTSGHCGQSAQGAAIWKCIWDFVPAFTRCSDANGDKLYPVDAQLFY